MHSRDAVFLDELCPKLRVRRWRQSLHTFTGQSCIYCGKPSESIDHIHPRPKGGQALLKTAYRPVCPATAENLTPTFSTGTGDSASMTHVAPWRFEPGWMATYGSPFAYCSGPNRITPSTIRRLPDRCSGRLRLTKLGRHPWSGAADKWRPEHQGLQVPAPWHWQAGQPSGWPGAQWPRSGSDGETTSSRQYI
jgi:hypothetical protein